MRSISIEKGLIELPEFIGHESMLPFDSATLSGLPSEFAGIVSRMMLGIVSTGTAFFTIHGKSLKLGETLRRGGPHTDGNYEPHVMSFGGGGWKVGQDGPAIDSGLHSRQYLNEGGGIILASNYASCLGWNGVYEGSPGVGGDCSHIDLDEPFMLEANQIYYGNNHFIHESLPVDDEVHRVFVRITMPETMGIG